MTTNTDQRWLEEGASPEVRSLLESAAIDEPTAAQLEGLTKRLEPQLKSPPPRGGGGAGGMGVAGKAGLALLAAGVVTGAFLLGRQSSRSGVEPPPAASPSPPPAVQPAVVAPAAPTVTETAPPQRVPEPKRPAPAVAPPAITAPRPTSPPPDEDADYELLHQAMQSPSAEEKLRLAEAHGARFPSSSLAQERDVLAIDALVKLGRTSEARTRFEAFAKRWPTSAHLVRLEHLLAP